MEESLSKVSLHEDGTDPRDLEIHGNDFIYWTGRRVQLREWWNTVLEDLLALFLVSKIIEPVTEKSIVIFIAKQDIRLNSDQMRIVSRALLHRVREKTLMDGVDSNKVAG